MIEHPILSHLLAQARDRHTPPQRFREIADLIGGLLAFEAARSLPTEPATVQTPLEACPVTVLKGPVTIVPILRAGMGMAGAMQRLIPDAQMGHIGLFRDEKSLQPVQYYKKLPARIAQGPTLLVDPMLATGGSAIAAADLLKEAGCTDIRFICLLAAPEGVAALSQAHQDIPITTAAIDTKLNDVGYILPGLGDAGDRIFGTTDPPPAPGPRKCPPRD